MYISIDDTTQYNFVDSNEDYNSYLFTSSTSQMRIDIQSDNSGVFNYFTFYNGNNNTAEVIHACVDLSGIYHIRTTQQYLYVTLSEYAGDRPIWDLEVHAITMDNYITSQIGMDISGVSQGDESGYSVSLSADGSIVAIGSIGNDNNTGHVRVYESSGNNWTQLGGDIDGGSQGDYSGFSVSLSSKDNIPRVAIGNGLGNGSDFNNVKLYEISDNNWVQLDADISGVTQSNNSGYSVSLNADGSRLAIGSVGNDDNSGSVRVYDISGNNWVQLGTDIDGETASDESGYSVSLSNDGSTVAIGAIYNNGTDISSGHVRVYQYNDVSWVQLGGDIDGEAAGDESGFSVSLSSDGSIVAIGAHQNDGNKGHVRVYQYNDPSWVQLGEDITGNTNDKSGYSVSLSADGSIVAVGSIQDDNNSGLVKLYGYSNSAWVQVGVDINGPTQGDKSGYSVSLNNDGSVVAIGSIGYNNDMGNVSVYEVSRPATIHATSSCPICFPAGTPVTTDQGVIAIEKINPNINTIRGKKIVAITKSTPMQNHIISIKKDAFAKNIPSAPTQISKEHKLLYKGKMVKARDLIGVCKGASKTPYNGEILYNVLLKKHDKMMINNLICETLDPENIVAKIINRKLKQSDVNKLYAKLNSIMITNDIPAYKKLHAAFK